LDQKDKVDNFHALKLLDCGALLTYRGEWSHWVHYHKNKSVLALVGDSCLFACVNTWRI